MTITLGIHPGHDAGATIVKDGKIIAAVDEERFRRQKFWGGGYPKYSVKFVMDYAKVKIEDIDAVGIPSRRFTKLGLLKMGIRYMRYPEMLREKFTKSQKKEIGYDYHSNVVRHGLLEQFGKCPRIIGIDHHMAHASSAYYPSGFKEPTIITSDGVGGAISSTVNIVRNGKIQRIASSLEPGSLGHFYEALTEGLDFLINSDEYKVMGMAAYGDWKKGGYDELMNMAPKVHGIVFRRKPWKIDSEYNNHFWKVSISESRFVKSLIAKYGKMNVAAAGQRVLEDIMLQWVSNIIRKTGKKEFCAAGGTFLNIKANKRIRDELGVRLFVFPHAGDGGLSAGCALYLNRMLNPRTRFEELESLALGPEYNNKEILEELKKTAGIKYKRIGNITKITANNIAKGKIVGWFQGRMEYGPRALGNRSILANPTSNKYKDKVNIQVKFREEWRPFCPSMLYEKASKYLVNADEAPFMVTSFDVPKDRIKEIEGVVHIDGTTRTQLVKKNIYRRYWQLIKDTEKKIGVPVVLNTSFNRKGEPIVCTPKDALNTFMNCGIDILAIGDYIVEKKEGFRNIRHKA